MRFALTAEQRAFRDAVDALLRDADGVAAARAWAAGDTKPGLEIWRGLAAIGLHSLAGEYHVELCAGLERVGYHAAPGPYPESLAVAASLAVAGDTEWLPRLVAGAIATVAVPPHSPYAPNADIAELCLPAATGSPITSLDPTRPLFPVAASKPEGVFDPSALFETASLFTAAQLLGLGRAALDMTVAYAKQRVQFGRAIGEYQAVKHRLADAHTGLEFARPLVFAAALSSAPADVHAAKAAAGEAAYQAARAALQVHGAIGYTDEYDLSVHFKKIRALYSAWGSPAFHRERLITTL